MNEKIIYGFFPIIPANPFSLENRVVNLIKTIYYFFIHQVTLSMLSVILNVMATIVYAVAAFIGKIRVKLLLHFSPSIPLQVPDLFFIGFGCTLFTEGNLFYRGQGNSKVSILKKIII